MKQLTRARFKLQIDVEVSDFVVANMVRFLIRKGVARMLRCKPSLARQIFVPGEELLPVVQQIKDVVEIPSQASKALVAYIVEEHLDLIKEE